MKKLISIFIIAAMCLTLAACKDKPEQTSSSETTAASVSGNADASLSGDASGNASYGHSASGNSSFDLSRYEGKTYTGSDPWGGELFIAIDTINTGIMKWTLSDIFEADVSGYRDYNDTRFERNICSAEFKGNADSSSKKVNFDYTIELELKNGDITMKYIAGALYEISEDGNSSTAYNQVDSLKKSEKTIVLKELTAK